MKDWKEQRIEIIIKNLSRLKEIITDLNEKTAYPDENITISNIQVPFSEVIKDALRGWLQLEEEKLRELLDQIPLTWLMSLDSSLTQAINNYNTYNSTKSSQNFQQFISNLNNINTYLNLPVTHYAFLAQLYRDIGESPRYVSEIKELRDEAQNAFEQIRKLLEDTKILYSKTWSGKKRSIYTARQKTSAVRLAGD